MALRFAPGAFIASSLLLITSLAGAVIAPSPTCGSEPACGVGFECAVVGASACAAAPPCAPGADCAPAEPCAPTEILGCVPAHCTTDAQCAPGMVCQAYTEPCPGVDCVCASDAPDCACAPSACDPVAVSICTPRYLLPCKTDVDCGDGFTCEEQQQGCAKAESGSAGAPTPSGDAIPAGGSAGVPSDPIEPVPGCDPQPSSVFQCVPRSIACQSASDCPAEWACQAPANVASPACPPGETCAADPVPLPPSKCVPPYWGGVVNGVDGSSTPTASNGGGSAGSGGATPGAAPEVAPTDDSSHESSACQMGRAPASNGAILLLALTGALFGLSRRRRA